MVKKMENWKINVRIKLAAIWIVAMFAYMYADILTFYEPGLLEEIIAGNVLIGSQISLLVAAILMSIPGYMVFLSLTLPYKATRWINIIVGIFHIVLAFGSLFVGTGDLFYTYFVIVEMGFISLAVWYAWKWLPMEKLLNN
jgi:hypothetical protein